VKKRERTSIRQMRLEKQKKKKKKEEAEKSKKTESQHRKTKRTRGKIIPGLSYIARRSSSNLRVF